MRVRERVGLPSGTDRQMEGCREGEAAVPCAQNGRGGGNERGPPPPAPPNRRTRPPGVGEREEGVLPSKQPPMAWREMALHLSVILLGEQLGEEGRLGKVEQRRNDFGARVGREAQKGNVGVYTIIASS